MLDQEQRGSLHNIGFKLMHASIALGCLHVCKLSILLHRYAYTWDPAVTIPWMCCVVCCCCCFLHYSSRLRLCWRVKILDCKQFATAGQCAEPHDLPCNLWRLLANSLSALRTDPASSSTNTPAFQQPVLSPTALLFARSASTASLQIHTA